MRTLTISNEPTSETTINIDEVNTSIHSVSAKCTEEHQYHLYRDTTTKQYFWIKQYKDYGDYGDYFYITDCYLEETDHRIAVMRDMEGYLHSFIGSDNLTMTECTVLKTVLQKQQAENWEVFVITNEDN